MITLVAVKSDIRAMNAINNEKQHDLSMQMQYCLERLKDNKF